LAPNWPTTPYRAHTKLPNRIHPRRWLPSGKPRKWQQPLTTILQTLLTSWSSLDLEGVMRLDAHVTSYNTRARQLWYAVRSIYADRLLIIPCVGSLMQACTLAETVSQPCPTLTSLISAQSMFSLSASTCLSSLLLLAFFGVSMSRRSLSFCNTLGPCHR
jgi:hypothetical protein